MLPVNFIIIMNKKKIFLWILVLSGLSYSCEKDEPEEQKKSEEILKDTLKVVDPTTPTEVTFLKVGSEYRYLSNSLFSTDSVRSVVEEQIDDNTYLVRNYSTSGRSVPTQYYRIENGDFKISFRLRDEASYITECKFNKPKGTYWSVTKYGKNYNYQIVGVNEVISTQNKVITDAVKVQITLSGGTSTSFFYYSPTVGMIGTGDFSNESTQFRLKEFSIGNEQYETGKTIKAITYGDFEFLKVGNYWEYNSEAAGKIVQTIVSKDQNNIYKTKTSIDGVASNTYWYEDNGYLMVYEEGETVLEADPIYVKDSKAVVGQGWLGLTQSNSTYIYMIDNVNEMYFSEYYNLSLPVTQIGVSSGLVSSQTNNWNSEKGEVSVTGLFSQELIQTNVRESSSGSYEVLAPFLAY